MNIDISLIADSNKEPIITVLLEGKILYRFLLHSLDYRAIAVKNLAIIGKIEELGSDLFKYHSGTSYKTKVFKELLELLFETAGIVSPIGKPNCSVTVWENWDSFRDYLLHTYNLCGSDVDSMLLTYTSSDRVMYGLLGRGRP